MTGNYWSFAVICNPGTVIKKSVTHFGKSEQGIRDWHCAYVWISDPSLPDWIPFWMKFLKSWLIHSSYC